MSRKLIVLITLLVLLFSLGIVGYSFFGVGAKTSNQSSQVLPVDPANAIVKSLDVSYVFGATLRSVHSYPSRFWLSTNLNDEQGVPKFYVTKDTKIIVDSGAKEAPGTINNLIAGDRIWITAVYDTKKKTWETTKVTIKKSSTSATPTP